MATPVTAANAYAALARLTEAGQGSGAGKASGGPDFGALLKDALGSVAQAGRNSDAQTHAMVTSGKANVVDVVTAVAETETAIDAVVAVRDKVIQAYEEIMRMPI
jgi:flagellar hook-basal body complex protein FliE